MKEGQVRLRGLSAVCVGKAEIEQAIKNEVALKDRTWRNVKDFVRNAIKRATKDSK